MAKIKETVLGCVAFEQPRPNTAYLNRLCVLPKYRHNGIGEQLVRFIFEYAQKKEIERISIGIIADHLTLKNWYLELGFTESKTQIFENLPFDVTYLHYELKI